MLRNEIFAKELKVLIEETFAKHHGMFTNRGTSLFETLETISAERASIIHGKDEETIAGHIFHMRFYLVVAQESMRKIRTDETDWDQSWVIKKVSEEQWKKLKDDLYAEYQKLMAFIDSVVDWNEEDYVSGMLGILAHNAFHLGAIRELNSV